MRRKINYQPILLVPKELNIETYKIIILSVILCERDTKSLALKEPRLMVIDYGAEGNILTHV
jgi:hypothetical protein